MVVPARGRWRTASKDTVKEVTQYETAYAVPSLFKALKTMNIGACRTAKAGSGFPDQLLRMLMAATKQTDWGKMGLMTTESSKKFGVDDGDILCMAWVDLNTVQYMTTCLTVDEMKTIIYKDEKRRYGIPKTSVLFDENETPKLSFPMPIVEYNTYMGIGRKYPTKILLFAASSKQPLLVAAVYFSFRIGCFKCLQTMAID